MNRKIELRVGVLVVFSILVTTFWLLFLKEFKFKTATYPVHVSFSDVGGIKPGAEVRILGVVKGKVEEVDLQRNDVVLTLAIEEDAFISRDAGFFLQSDMINPATIRVVQGAESIAITADAHVKGMESGGVGGLMSESSALIRSLNLLAERLDAVTANGRVEELVGEFESSSRELNLLLSESRGKAGEILARVDRLSTSLEEIAAENREPAKQVLVSLNRFALNADSLSTRLAGLIESMAAISGRIEAGEGSIGKAMADERLYENVVSTVARLDSLLDAVKRNPKDFVTFSIF